MKKLFNITRRGLNRLLDRLLSRLGLELIAESQLAVIQRLAVVGRHKLLWLLNSFDDLRQLEMAEKHRILDSSFSQLGQDILALGVQGGSRKGFFVEFGATNGFEFSNTFLLESRFGWDGILCEPAKIWHEALHRNRAVAIDHRSVYSSSGETLTFLETKAAELSTIVGYGLDDSLAHLRSQAKNYPVETVSLLDLLKHHNAPKHIDLLSVDTEGSEFEILNAFDFSQFSFGAIVVEHNYTDAREKVRDLLVSKGYRQVYRELSDFDDWFILSTIQNIPA